MNTRATNQQTTQPQCARISGGIVDRKHPLSFIFDSKTYHGYHGDTLASALLANGVHLVGRSFKYHRPRGIFSSGSEEPNGLVEIGIGAKRTPNTRATTVELYDGLVATSQNRWPNLNFDILSVNDLLSSFLSAGFYYKTFMWPGSFWEKIYEPIIRRSAGLGKLSLESDPDHYDKGSLHCDILIIGAGPSGLMAALSAGRRGARVIIADEDFHPGGQLLGESLEVDSMPGAQWASTIVTELKSLPNIRFMPRTTIYGMYDHGIFGAVEANTDHLATTSRDAPRQTLWRIYTKHSILASGAIERPIAFGNNDRPGIMSASAVRTYCNRYAAMAGGHISVFTNNDDGFRTAIDMQNAGAHVTLLDTRTDRTAPEKFEGRYISAARIINTAGRKRVTALTLSTGEKVKTDCVAVSGGWNPTLNLTCHKRSKPVWREDISAFVPDTDSLPDINVIGAANGVFSTHHALQQGIDISIRLCEKLGRKASPIDLPDAEDSPVDITPFWHVAESTARAFVDFQNDVTVKDIALGEQEGFRSVEHLKRYTTLGMATDQGKSSNVIGLAVMAELTGKTIPETGTTIFRPPYTPVAIGAFAGIHRGVNFKPIRECPSHAYATEQGAEFVEAGNWRRAQWFPKEGELQWRQTVDREVLQVRRSVGVCDVTTLGKIDIQGPDAAEFLNRVYANTFSTLKVGKCRYGIMLREDGIIKDDGTTARLSETEYVMTTTTANAVSVYRHLEFCRQCLWPDLNVQLISATEQWAQYAIAGPNARNLLLKLVDEKYDISNTGLPYMGCAELTICNGIRARLFRLSFSGELAYELAVPARFGDSLFRTILSAGEEFDIVPYGTEALGVMRIEKGHAAGNELNGTTTAQNLGLGRMVSPKKDCIGKVLSERPGLACENLLDFVGFKPTHRTRPLSAGAHLFATDVDHTLDNDEGYITSVAWSPTLQTYIGLGFIANGAKRLGEKVTAANPLQDKTMTVEICSPHFYDPGGEKLHG